MIKYNRRFIGKLAISLLVIILGGVTSLGCSRFVSPVGWSGVVIERDVVFFGNTEGELVALGVSSGTQLDDIMLEVPQSSGGMGCFGTVETVTAIYGTPAVAGDMIYFGSYMKESNITQGKFYAFEFNWDENSFEGDEQRWEYPRGEYFDGPIVGGAVVALDKVYFGCSDGKVYALDAEGGYREWDFETGGKVWSTPVIKGETLFVGSFDKNLYALDANSGEEIWRYEAGGGIAGTPLVDGDTVYFGSFDRHVYAIDADSGDLIWRSEVEAGSWFWARPLVYNNAIYAPCVDGNVYILNAENGKLIDMVAPGIVSDGESDSEQDNEEISLIRSSPVLVGSSVIVATGEGVVYILDTSSNSFEKLEDVGAEVYAPLVADDDIVYVHTQEGSIYALDVQKKVRIWGYP